MDSKRKRQTKACFSDDSSACSQPAKLRRLCGDTPDYGQHFLFICHGAGDCVGVYLIPVRDLPKSLLMARDTWTDPKHGLFAILREVSDHSLKVFCEKRPDLGRWVTSLFFGTDGPPLVPTPPLLGKTLMYDDILNDGHFDGIMSPLYQLEMPMCHRAVDANPLDIVFMCTICMD